MVGMKPINRVLLRVLGICKRRNLVGGVTLGGLRMGTGEIQPY